MSPGNSLSNVVVRRTVFSLPQTGPPEAQGQQSVPSRSDLECCLFRSDIKEVSERRKDPRIPYIARTQIIWDSPNGEISLTGMIEDKSVSGLGIEVSRAIPVGTSVRIRLGNQMISAVVRRCIKTDFGSFVGVSFEAPAAPPEATLSGPEYVF